MKRVKVIWIDSQSNGSWVFRENIELKIEPCISTGFIIKEDKDFICIAHTAHKKETGVMGYVIIPKISITKIKRYKKGK